MVKQGWSWVGCWAALWASHCLAQSVAAVVPPEAGATSAAESTSAAEAGDGTEAMPSAQGTLLMLPEMTKELNLDAKQQVVVRQTLEKYEASTKELREMLFVPPEVREKVNSLVKE